VAEVASLAFKAANLLWKTRRDEIARPVLDWDASVLASRLRAAQT